MEMLGTKWEAGRGHTIADLEAFREKLTAAGETTEWVSMSHEGELAAVLVWKGGVEGLLGPSSTGDGGPGEMESLFKEQAALNKDTKALMRGRVVNKKARHNLCFAEKGHAADYAAGRGTVVAYDDVPMTKRLVEGMEAFFGRAKGSLIAEGNYYYDLKKCGIGFHGDTERRIVYAARLGASMPLHFQWFHRCEPVGERIVVPLDGGDVYVMSEKAVGADWRCSSKVTLRHATGSSAYTTIKAVETPKAAGGAGVGRA